MHIMVKKLSSRTEEESYLSISGKYIKAVPLNEENEFNEPVVGEKFMCCRIFTSPVEKYTKVKNGWLVQTENSNYMFMVAELESIKSMAEREGMLKYNDPFFVSPGPGIYYWKKPE